MIRICCLCIFVGSAFASQMSSSYENLSVVRFGRSSDDVYHFTLDTVNYPRDCAEIYNNCANETSGVFSIQPEGAKEPFQVYCNNSIEGGKWTVFQRRVDGSVDFYRSWDHYKTGFGFLNTEFWLGNDKLSLLTNQKDCELRIDMIDHSGTSYYANYGLFRISDEFSKYRLVSIGEFDSASTAVHDRLMHHLNHSFTTFDHDNDNLTSGNNAVSCRGGWWYSSNCVTVDDDLSNLNGLYSAGSSGHMSIYWDDLGGSSTYQIHLSYSEMKIRPKSPET